MKHRPAPQQTEASVLKVGDIDAADIERAVLIRPPNEYVTLVLSLTDGTTHMYYGGDAMRDVEVLRAAGVVVTE